MKLTERGTSKSRSRGESDLAKRLEAKAADIGYRKNGPVHFVSTFNSKLGKWEITATMTAVKA